MIQAAHVTDAVAPVTGEYKPTGQPEHEALPGKDAYWPAVQTTQFAEPLAPTEVP